MRGGSQRAFCQSRRLASKDNKMLLMQTMEDSSRRRIYDCRFANWPQLWRLTNLLVKIEHYKRQMEGLGKNCGLP
jgi:hypothetical protein